MAGKAFSVHVDIGGRLNSSLGAAVRAADAQVASLGRSIGAVNARTNETIRTFGTGLASAGKKVQEVGRNVSTSVSAPMGILAYAGGKMAYDYEKSGNLLQALGDASDEQRAKFEAFANELNKKYPQSLADIINTGNEMLKGGFSFNQMLGGIDQTLATAVLGEMDPAEVGNMMSRTINSFQMPMATYEQAMASSQQVSDRMTYAAVKTTASLRDMGEMFRYVGGAMSSGGQDIDKATAFAMAFAKNGTVASEAGVALRSAIVRLVKMPDKGMNALARVGMDLNDYVKGTTPITADRVLSGLQSGGIDASGAKEQIAALLKDKSIARSTAQLGLEITKAVQEAIGSSSAIDAATIADNVNDAIVAAGNQIDVFQFFKDLQAKIEAGVASSGDVATILEGRHYSRYQAVLKSDLDALLAGVQGESGGYTQSRYGMVLEGIVGPTLALGAAMEKLSVTLSKGIFPALAVAFERVADSIQSLSESSPKLLKFAAFTGLATIALGPFLIVAGGAARVLAPLASGLLSLGTAATVGLATRLTAVAGGVRALALAATVGAATRIRAMGAGLITLAAVGGRGAVLGTLAGGLTSFGKKLLLFPLTTLKAIAVPLLTIGAVSAGGLIAITAAFAALGLWVYNNWEGLKSFFSGFADGLSKGLNPTVVGAVKAVADGFGSIFNWVSQLLGPLQSTNTEWRSWGETVGGAVAGAANAVVSAIEKVIGLFSAAIEKARSFASAVAEIGAGAGYVAPHIVKGGLIDRTFGGGSNSTLDGKRARGGPVRAGGTYLVGERGPEIFTAGQSGKIVANHRLGALASRAEGAASGRSRAPVAAPVQVSNHFHVNGGDLHEIERAAERATYRAIARMESRQRGFLSD